MIIKGMLRKIVDPPLSIQELHKALHNFILARSKGLRSEEHTSELQSRSDLVCRLLLEKKKIHRHGVGTHDEKPSSLHSRAATPLRSCQILTQPQWRHVSASLPTSIAYASLCQTIMPTS